MALIRGGCNLIGMPLRLLSDQVSVTVSKMATRRAGFPPACKN